MINLIPLPDNDDMLLFNESDALIVVKEYIEKYADDEHRIPKRLGISADLIFEAKGSGKIDYVVELILGSSRESRYKAVDAVLKDIARRNLLLDFMDVFTKTRNGLG